MQKKTLIVFDDYVIGATALLPAYTHSEFNDALSKFDRFAIQCVVDNVTASTTLDVFVEHSPDGEHWLHANGTADHPPAHPPVPGQGNVVFGSLSTTQTNAKTGDSGAGPLFSLARLQILFGNGTTGAHVKITVTPRDAR